MAVTQQGEDEGGIAWGIGGGLRGEGFDAPARFRGAGLRGTTEAGEQNHDAGGLCGEHEAARGVQVERLGRAADLADDNGDGGAAGGFDGGAQGRRGGACAHEEHAGRIEPEGGQAVGGQRADFTVDIAGFGPHDGGGGVAGDGADGKRGGKAARGGGIGQPFGDDLVQGGALEAAAGGGIERGVAEQHATGRCHRRTVIAGRKDFASQGFAGRTQSRAALGIRFGACGSGPGRLEFGQASPQRRELFSRRGHDYKTLLFLLCSKLDQAQSAVNAAGVHAGLVRVFVSAKRHRHHRSLFGPEV